MTEDDDSGQGDGPTGEDDGVDDDGADEGTSSEEGGSGEGDDSDGESGDGDSSEDGSTEDSDAGDSTDDSSDDSGDSGDADDGSSEGDSGSDSGESDSEGDSGDDTGPVDGDDFCDVLSEVMCEADQSCCTNSDWQYDSVADCVADQVPQCETDLQDLIEDSRTAYDPNRAREVLDELEADTQSCDLGISQWFVSRADGLLSVFAGTVPMGGDCSPANADDGGAILSCTDGNACRVTPLPLSGTCGMHKTASQQCVTHFECNELLWCTAPDGGVGQCEARKSNSESCTDTIECESLQCEGGSCVEATVDLVYCANR
jgi:hypothetical protein